MSRQGQQQCAKPSEISRSCGACRLQSVPEWVPQEKTPCLERSAWPMCAHRLWACVLLLLPSPHSLPLAKSSFAAHKRSLHHVQQGSTSAAGGETQGTWAFSAGMQVIHLLLCGSVLAAVLRSSAKSFCLLPMPQEKYSPRETGIRLQP